MRKRVVSEIMLTLLLISMLTLAFNIQYTRASRENPKYAPKISITYYFPEPKIEEDCASIHACLSNKRTDSYVSVIMDDLPQYEETGLPVLPFKTAKILLPFGTQFEHVRAIGGKKMPLLGSHLVEYGQKPVPLTTVESADASATNLPNKTVYASPEPFPNRLYSDVSVQSKMGYKILLVNLYPVEYIPKTGKLFYYESIRLEVEVTSENRGENSAFNGYSQHREIVEGIVDNPEVIETYPTSQQTTTYQYVIITNEELNSTPGPYNFQALRDDKISRGIPATIVTVEWIYANYDGTRPDGDEDSQTKIRNFIIDAYNNWSTMYVLLGGDGDGDDVGGESGDAIIPHRGFASVSGEIDYDIPADMYYGCLDGTFDYDGDGIYGEPNDGPGGGEVDLFSEVYVGRACVDSQVEVQNFVRKTLSYQNASVGVGLRKVWMVGEDLNWAVWGGDYKDEIKEGSDAHGYTTAGFENSLYANRFDVSTLYDRDYPGNDWPKSEIIGVINDNVHLINHMGHANVGYMMKMTNTDVDNLTNDELYFVGYSQGCYCGSFDDRSTTPGNYTSYDCISEHLTTEANGSVAFISNSRYGWGIGDSTDGPSQHYDREFWDAVLGEEIFNIGIANQDSKEDNAGRVGSWVERYCYYEINLFGDPELRIKLPPAYQHELDVAVEAPDYLKPGDSSLLNATVYNRGLSNETDVELFLLINGTIANNVTIPELVNGKSYTIDYLWTPTAEATYNVTAYAVPVPGENVTANNWYTKFVRVTYAVMIGIIETHGESLHSEGLVNYYTSLGHVVEKITTTITPGVLDNYDIIIVGEDWSDTHWLPSEIAAVEAFIDSGKGFIAIGDQLATSVQEILDTNGINYTGINAPGGSSSHFDPLHPIMQDVSLIYAGSPINSLQITSPAYWIANDTSDTYIIIAGAEVGGYALCLSDDFAAYLYNDDNEVMFKNIIDWMTVKYEHELVVCLDAPNFLGPGDSSLLNATVYNRGLNNETDVELFLLINGTAVNNVTIPELVNGTYHTIDYLWTPTEEGIYNVTVYAPPVPDENVTANNVKSIFVLVQVFPAILIVNDNDGSSWVSGTSLQEFESALTVAGYDYWVWDESSMGNPPLGFLTKFQLVIWTCGDYYGWAVDPTDAATLESYLAQGGNILLEGEDVGFDHDADNFMVNVAHAVYQVDDTGAPGLTVTDSTHPVTLGLPTNFTWLTDPPYDDGVNSTNGGFEVIRYTNTLWTAVTVFNGTGTGNGSVAFYAFPIYCLAQPERDTLIINCVNWFLLHDIAIRGVTLSKAVVGQGYPVSINVTVKNQGNFPETFNVTAYYNDIPIETKNVTSLPPGEETTVNFTWDTTGCAMDVYTISANVTKVPGEIDTADNIHIDGTVQIATVGDLNGDGHVDLSDLTLLASFWFNVPCYNPQADISDDGITDVSDLTLLAGNWFKGPLD